MDKFLLKKPTEEIVNLKVLSCLQTGIDLVISNLAKELQASLASLVNSTICMHKLF